jgi:hypothetical protein
MVTLIAKAVHEQDLEAVIPIAANRAALSPG